METKGTLLYAQVTAIGPCPEPDEPSSHSSPISLRYIITSFSVMKSEEVLYSQGRKEYPTYSKRGKANWIGHTQLP